jgi:hypothetical protein
MIGDSCKAMEINSDFFKKHLSIPNYSIDPEAGAVVLFENIEVSISTEIEGRGTRYIQTETVHKIVRILKPDALHEADVTLYLYKDGKHYYINDFKASTFNLSGNEVHETKLNKSDIYAKEISKYYFEYTFTFPEVKEGSITEYSYIRTSPVESYFPRWAMQGKYPRLMSEYSISFPERFEFTTITHCRDTAKKYPTVPDAENSNDNFCEVKRQIFSTPKRIESAWVRKNIPAVRQEPYVNTLQNFVENMEFKLTGYYTALKMVQPENSWEKLNSELMQDEYFGKAVFASNSFLDKITDSLTKACPDIHSRINAVYDYVRSNFTDKGKHNIYLKTDLKDVFNTRAGYANEINLALSSLLIHSGIAAAPLILATRGNLSPSPAFPIANRFNYVACAVSIDSGFIFLDASDKNNVVGMLPEYCYNGYARIIKKDGIGINLTANVLKEKTVVSIKLNFTNDTVADIEIFERVGLISSSEIRKAWAKNERGRKLFMDSWLNNVPDGLVLIDSDMEYLNAPDTNLVIKLSGKISFNKNEQGYIYLNSSFVKQFQTNPFKATRRTLPIEFPDKSRYVRTMTVTLPKDIIPNELPPPLSLNIENGGIVYNRVYNFNSALHMLTVSSDYNLGETVYPAESYSSIRNFYADMINGDNDVIVLKKDEKK